MTEHFVGLLLSCILLTAPAEILVLSSYRANARRRMTMSSNEGARLVLLRKVPSMMSSSFLIALIFLTILFHCETALAFVSRPARSAAFRKITTNGSKHQNLQHLCMIGDNPFATEAATTKITEVQDKNGSVFQVGGIVRVVRENLKAYQIPPKGYGSFDSDKKFVPISENAPRAKKNLVLPVGMRGTVTKIYDKKEISANLPVQVKFTPGENLDEGYDPPVPFSMHFQPMEVECA